MIIRFKGLFNLHAGNFIIAVSSALRVAPKALSVI